MSRGRAGRPQEAAEGSFAGALAPSSKASMAVPPGWPFPGVDMSNAQFNSAVLGNSTEPAASSFSLLAPISGQQVKTAGCTPYQQSMSMLGSPGPAVASSGGQSSSSEFNAFTSPTSLLPPVYNPGATLQPLFQPQSRLNFNGQSTSAAGMQYCPQAQAQGQMFNMAQPGQQMVAQNNFYSRQQNMYIQSSFPEQSQMMTEAMMPRGQMMLMSPTSVPNPVPVQYQNHFSNHSRPMVPYQSHFKESQEPEHTVIHPSAAKYRFSFKGTPPFVDLTRDVAPSEKPIICIKNIPYTITQNEIQQFLSKSLLPHSPTHLTTPGPASLPIHVVMERGTGKTQDCFVELPSQDVANICIERVENLVMAGKPPKMAQRIVNVELSSQGELMKEIFPRAKNVLWDEDTGIPVMLKPVDSFCSGFRGFLTGEELNNVMRFAETPQRSPFAIRCQQRTYEMTMTTLVKFPWASIYYNLEQRDLLFRAYINQLLSLLPKVFVEEYGGNRNQRVVGLDARLVASFVEAGLNCPGFNEAQKSDILDVTNQNYAYRSVSEFAPAWPFETLSKPVGVDDHDLGEWLKLMYDGAQSALQQKIVLAVGEADRQFVEVKFDEWGQIYTNVSHEGRTKVSFADLARMETQLMKCMLLHGWEKAFGTKELGLYDEGDEYHLTEVEKKMMGLGAFKLGIDRPDVRGNPAQDTAGRAASKDKELKAPKGVSAQQAGQDHGEKSHFEDPFHGRAKSVASDSGFSGMHRGMGMIDLAKDVDKIAMQVHGTVPLLRTLGSVEKDWPSYSRALSTILVDAGIANPTAQSRGGKSVVPIKSPDGKELDFSHKIFTPASSSTRHSSPDRYARTSDTFNTPRRRSDSSTGSSGCVSPRTKTRSPKKSYTMQVSPGPTQALGPIGTPSRRSLQDNVVNIGATINEEVEDESIMMRGGRGRGRGPSSSFH